MDPLLIKQVIVNLLENAIRHSGDRDHITLRLYRQEDWAVVEVRDQGHGLSPEVLQAIQAGQAMPLSGDATRGMGIGLSVCQSIIQIHEGFFEAENGSQGGAVFRFGLPIVPAAALYLWAAWAVWRRLRRCRLSAAGTVLLLTAALSLFINAVTGALTGGRALYGDSLFTLVLAAVCFLADYVLRHRDSQG